MKADRLTNEQAAILSAFTGTMIGSFSNMHAAIEAKLGRPVWTHQLANEKTVAEIKEAFRSDFMSIMPEEKERT